MRKKREITKKYITCINMDKMQENLFPEFELITTYMSSYTGKSYIYSRPSDSANITFKFAIYKSTAEAKKVLNDLF
ncbi:MAG: hypothetical protein HC906_06485 [Bacteroidales bacterium]|nr:hypothetical protein [Bacteroidales bacterium]